MNKLLFIFLILFPCFEVLSQEEIWNDVTIVDSAQGVFVVSEMVIDNLNNKYVANLSIDEINASKGRYGLCVTKYDEKNKIVWKNKLVSSSNSNNISEAISLSSDNRKIIQYGILFRDTITVEEEEYISKGGLDVLYITISTSGELVKVNQFGGRCNEGLGNFNITDEALFLAANFGQNSNSKGAGCSFNFENFLFLNNDRDMAPFLGKIVDDSLIWYHQSKLDVHHAISNIDVVNNQVYTIGSVKSWSNTNINGLNINIPYSIDFPKYVAKYDTAGNPLWIKYFGLKGILTSLRTTDIYADKFGVTVTMIGLTSDAGGKNELLIQQNDSLTGSGSSIVDFFIINYDYDGNVLWAKKSSNIGDAIVSNLVKYKNLFYITGYFKNEIHFNNDTIFSQGGNDIFVACYNANGEEEWIKTAGGRGNDTANSIALDQARRIYVCGGTSSNPVTFGDITVEPPHPNNVFLARLSEDPILSISPTPTLQNQTLVYPNPATERLYLQHTTNPTNVTSLVVYNTNGQLLKQNFELANNGIDVQFLETGVYFLKITYSNGQQQVVKWCKQ